MIILIRNNRDVRNFNNWTTIDNEDLLDINEIFKSVGSTILFYTKKLPSEVKTSNNTKRQIKSISEIDIDKINQDCIIFYHSDIFKDEDFKLVESLFEFCKNTRKSMVIQFSLGNQHLFNHICNGEEVYVEEEEINEFKIKLLRDLKINSVFNI
jgi:hypothetical protein